MKIYRWIDKYNRKNSFKIIRKYHFGVATGRSKYFFLHSSFWLKYLLRLLLVLVSILSIQKAAYLSFFKIISSRFSVFTPPTKNLFYLKLNDLISTLFGYRYFMLTETLPLLNNETILKSTIKIHTSTTPYVSIIIPVYNHLDYTFNCLKSIELNISTKYPIEIIVVDDCSTDLTETFMRTNVKGLQYLRNEQNKGFILSCNEGAKVAKGKYICFLNNDVQIKKNWLDYLILTFDQENVGLVGSKLIYANGMLQEAGGIVFSDSNAANYGRYEDKENPLFNYSREVDYCSGASILLLRADFEELGLFDLRYIPAYYEDTDICFAVRHVLKKKVIYQPLSEVIHFEGISSGTDIEKHPVKKYQQINKIKFAEKWEKQLNEYPALDDFETAINKYNRNKTILIIDDTIPEPDKDSGSVRLSHIIEILKSLGHHIIFLPNDGMKKEKYFEKLALSGVEVIYKFPNRQAILKQLTQNASAINVAWICKPQNNPLFEIIFKKKHQAFRIYDTIDLHYLRMQREANLTNNGPLHLEAQNTKEQELGYAKMADLTIAITNEEKSILEQEGIKKVAVIPNIHVSQHIPPINSNSFTSRKGILFIGGYAHTPNVDAAKWLIGEIMPIVWKIQPEINVTLLGSNPTDEVLKLQNERVLIPGYVEDVEPFFNANRVFVASLRYGAGMKGKIGQSLSYGLPIITSDIGAEGMSLTDGVDFLRANTAEEFAEKILSLYDNEGLWMQLAVASKVAIDQYDPVHIKRTIALILSEINN